MKKTIFFLFIILAMGSSAFSQSSIPEFDKAKQIKLLEATREKVKKILADFENDDLDDESQFQSFSNKVASYQIYSTQLANTFPKAFLTS